MMFSEVVNRRRALLYCELFGNKSMIYIGHVDEKYSS
jgi:hypothetical protein